MIDCPIGLKCPESFCPNLAQCEDLGISWELPYQRREDGLYVNCSPRRWLWFGYWELIDTSSETKKRIREAWREEGFCSAQYLPSYLRRYGAFPIYHPKNFADES